MLLTDFDASSQAVINPDMLFSPVPDLPETAVSCFSHVTFERMLDMAAGGGGRGAEGKKPASAEPNTSSRWTAPFGPIPGVRVRAMSGISRFIFRIRQSPNEFGSASFGRNRRFRTRFGASVSGCKDRFLPIKMQSCPEVLQKREIFVYLQTRSRESGSDGRVARQRSAKPCTAVRIRFRPHRNRVAAIYNAVLFLNCHTFVIPTFIRGWFLQYKITSYRYPDEFGGLLDSFYHLILAIVFGLHLV